ncbi:hypothetical protein BC830DRAFT_649954 [Chytriomyces sp. MP71]|nr:hypothetical protein BC830DRAFT_649954 [Chytriomyces sp. MP71]
MLRKSQLPARTSSKRGLEGSRAVGQEDLDSRGDEEPPWDAASAQEGAAEGAEEKVGLLNRVLFEEPEEEEDQDVETNEVRSRIMHRLDDLLHGLSPTSEPDSVARQLYPTASATNNPDGTALAALVGPHEHEEGEQDPFDAIAEILLEYTDPAETNTDTCPATNTLDCFRIVELVDTAGNRISVLNPADTPARHPHKEHKSFRISVALQSSPASSANSNSSSPRAPRIVSMLRYRLVTAIGAPRLSSPEEPSTGTYSELLASGMKLLPGLWGTGGTATAAAAAAESVTAVRRVERRGSVRVVSVDLVSPPALCAREVEEVEEEVEDEEEFEGQGLVVGSVDSEIMKPFRLLEVRKVGFVRQERTSSLNRS